MDQFSPIDAELDPDLLLDCPANEYSETLICPICYELTSLVEAMIFYPCGHTLCKNCQQEVFNQYGSWCPIDKQPVVYRCRNRLVEQLVSTLQCRCDNSRSHPEIANKDVCTEILTLDKRSQHLRECPYSLIPCKYLKRGCTEQCLRKDLEEHQENCAFNLEECPNERCTYEGRSSTIAAHRKECPWELIHCKARSFGCNALIFRKNYKEHQNTCVFIEQKLVQDSKLDAIRREVDELYRQVNALNEPNAPNIVKPMVSFRLVGELLRDEDNSFSALDIVE